MSTKFPTPMVSPVERYLKNRAIRFAEDAPGLIVRLLEIPEKAILFPRELAVSLIRRRRAKVVANLNTVPDLTLTEEDVEKLKASGTDLWA